MDRAALLLARAWHRAWRGWWRATGAALAAVLVLVLGSVAVVDGTNRATEATVADFYAGDLRVTAEGAGAAPDARFAFNGSAELEAARARLEHAAGAGSSVVPRLETTYLLSRRTLLEAFLSGDGQFGVDVQGGQADRDAYRVGILDGVPFRDPSVRSTFTRYLVAGRLPDPGNGSGPVEVLLSQRQFRGLLDPTERASLSEPPTAQQLAQVRLELTAAHLASGPVTDLIRRPAVVVGLFTSGVEALDRLTLLASIEDVRTLLGAPADSGLSNAFTITGPHARSAQPTVAAEGWHSESAATFTHRYLGQLVDLLRAAGIVVACLLLAAPFLMVWIGLAHQLDRSRRELAVGRAIGLPVSSVRRSLLLLSARILVMAIVACAVLLVLGSLSVGWWSPPPGRFPVPLAFHVPWWAVLATLANLVLSTGLAVWGALHRHVRIDLGSALRSA